MTSPEHGLKDSALAQTAREIRGNANKTRKHLSKNDFCGPPYPPTPILSLKENINIKGTRIGFLCGAVTSCNSMWQIIAVRFNFGFTDHSRLTKYKKGVE